METKDLIIETAFIAFLENGYDRVSLNKIVKNTGLTKGAFYHNFASKSDLMYEVMKRYFFKHLDDTINLIDGSGDSFEEKLSLIIQNVMNVNIRLNGQNGKSVDHEAFFTLFQECTNIDEELKKMTYNQEQKILKIMTSVIDEAIEKDELRDDVDSKVLAGLISVIIRGTMLSNTGLDRKKVKAILNQNLNTLILLIKK